MSDATRAVALGSDEPAWARLSRFEQALDSGLAAWRFAAIAGISIIYLGLSIGLAANKIIWTDEFLRCT
jgi:hypothetical protein